MHSLQDYQVVFETTQRGICDWQSVAMGLVGMGAGVAMWRFNLGASLGARPQARWFAPVFVWFSTIWTLVVGVGTARSRYSARRALETGDCRVVEGAVHNFVPVPQNGKGYEQFTVAGHQFSYAEYIMTPGFNQTTLHGGPIRQGLRVRICYRDEDILRLEVAR